MNTLAIWLYSTAYAAVLLFCARFSWIGAEFSRVELKFKKPIRHRKFLYSHVVILLLSLCMGKRRRLEICEIEQHSQPSLSHGSPQRTESRGASQPTQPHGSSQTIQLPRASQPHHLSGTSRPSNPHSSSRPIQPHCSSQPHEVEGDLDVQANEQRVNAQPMDKTWMSKSRSSRDYLQGVMDFLQFASLNASNEGTILCPCVQCVNSFMLSLNVVHDHLVSFGISQCYDCWYYHGETISAPTSSKTCETPIEQIGLQFGDIEEMLNDVYYMHTRSMNDIRDDTNEAEPFSQSPSEQPAQEANKNAQRFYELLKDAKQPLYEGCQNFSKLLTIVHWYHLKCLRGLSNKTFTVILQLLKAILPPDAKLPKDCYEAKKIIKDLGLGYEKIHACPKDCMLFWKEHANDDFCKKCGASRWATNDNNLQPNSSTSSKKVKKKAAKVLRWLPLKPILQRLYMTLETTESMKWHAEGRTKDVKMRHLADTPTWKYFDSKNKAFAAKPHNVRLGIASDGFNPYGHMSTSYSVWPVILIPYNLPPWMCMKRSNFILSLLIPGPSSPSKNIDVYLQPSVEELKELWEVGVKTYDVSSKQNFQLRAFYMWTVNDLPAYGYFSGWNTQDALACPSCNYGTTSRWLKNGGKYCFMGHRRFLDKNHRFRKDRISFDENHKMELAPRMLSGMRS
ncbi:hypothetical protein RHSIM_Rhsim01G0178900 [Rhododendron simsii]|uniref:Transposase-associated domain-containing protein n=1 Tax=Rhododendron simsii TaxID=118357 RepID=A0A834HI97_RHOSS|nr:hypothetical protein RHSIM_Rhsim01G0178900 [Rhododendron simsii]